MDVGEALVAEPEPFSVDVAHDAKPVADQRARDDDQSDPEQKIDQEALPRRFAAAGDGRCEEQGRADPRDADPHNRRLDVHITKKIKRQDVVQLQAIEAAPVIIGVGHDRAGCNLQEQDEGDDEEVLAHLALAFS